MAEAILTEPQFVIGMTNEGVMRSFFLFWIVAACDNDMARYATPLSRVEPAAPSIPNPDLDRRLR
jgi:hypothetical protein